MPTTFPTNLDNLLNPSATDTMDTPTLEHDLEHDNVNDAIEAIQAKIGIDNSAVSSSIDYILRKLVPRTDQVLSYLSATSSIVLKANASQTAVLQEWRASDNTTLGQVFKFSGENTGELQLHRGGQVAIDLVAGRASSITSQVASLVPLLIKGAASQTGNLLEFRDSANALLTVIASTGRIDSGGVGGSYLLNPTGSPSNRLNATSAGRILLSLEAITGQTANLTEWKDATPSTAGFVGPGGILEFRQGRFGGTASIANVALTLSPYLGQTGNVPLVVQGVASQSGDLTQWQSSTPTTIAKITSDGVGMFSTSDGALVTDPSGNSAQVLWLVNRTATAGDSAGLKWADAALSKIYGAIEVSYITRTASAEDGLMNFTVIRAGTRRRLVTMDDSVKVFASVAGQVPLITQGAASQSADLQQWKNSGGTVLAGIDKTGRGFFGTTAANTGAALFVKPQATGEVATLIQGLSGQTANLSQWNTNSGVVCIIDAAGQIRNTVSGVGFSTGGSTVIQYDYPAVAGAYTWDPTLSSGPSLLIKAGASTVVPVAFRGAASQTADLQQWQSNTPTTLLRVNSGGRIISDLAGSGVTEATVDGAVLLNTRTSGTPALSLAQRASQTGNVFQVTDSAGAMLTTIAAGGGMFWGSGSDVGLDRIVANTLPFIRVTGGRLTSNAGGFTISAASGNGSAVDLQSSGDAGVASTPSQGGRLRVGGVNFGFGGSTEVWYGTDTGYTGAFYIRRWNPSPNTAATAPVIAQLDSLWLWNGISLTMERLATPTGVTVSPQGTTGATTYGYRVAAVSHAGTTMAAATATTTTGNATLSVSNFNRVSWTAVAGAAQYKVYGRTSGSELLIATVGAGVTSYDDTGAVTPSGALPTAPAGNTLLVRGWESQTAALLSLQDSASIGRFVYDMTNGLTMRNSGGNTNFAVGPNGETVIGSLNASGVVGLIIKGNSGQTADLQQWSNSSGTALARVTKDGDFQFGTQSLPRGTMPGGYVQNTSGQGSITTLTDITGLSATVTTVTGRRYRISAYCYNLSNTTAGAATSVLIREGSTTLQISQQTTPGANYGLAYNPSVVITPSAGSHTYKVSVDVSAGTATFNAGATAPAYILVEDIGT
jgi:hypothetical protein